jgi:hypothetical protein
MNGGPGGSGGRLSGTQGIGSGGGGASGGGFGAGTALQHGSGDGAGGRTYGGGGGGGFGYGGVNTSGGDGAPGVIRITEYFDSGSAAILAGGLPTGGTAGQSLIKNTGTNYDASWVNDLSITVYQGVNQAPTGTTSTTGVMCGLGTATYGSTVITPARSGKIFASMQGSLSNSVAGGRTIISLKYGTGTPPVNGAAPTGTSIGGSTNFHPYAANIYGPFAVSAIITGLTLGVPIWVDLMQQSYTGGGTGTVAGVTACAYELP